MFQREACLPRALDGGHGSRLAISILSITVTVRVLFIVETVTLRLPETKLSFVAMNVQVSRYFHDRLAHGVLNRLLMLDQLDYLGLGGGHGCRLSQLRGGLLKVTVVAKVAVEFLLLVLFQLYFVSCAALLVVFRFLIILPILSSNGLLNVCVAERGEQLVVALLLSVQGLILGLSELLLGQ